MYLLGIDIGSSSLKAAVFDESGTLLKLAKGNYPINGVEKGLAEQDAEDYYSALLACLGELGKDALGKVGALAICGQTPTDIFVDKNGAPLRPAIMWRDTRATAQLERQMAHYTFDDLEGLAGCPIPKSANWSTLRIAWVLENEPDVAKRLYKVLQPKDYLVLCLTGEFVTDKWSARPYANVQTGKINEELMRFFGTSGEVVPEILGATELCGSLKNEEVAALGLSRDVKIVCGSSDGFAAMISSGLFAKERTAFNSTGTSEIVGVGLSLGRCGDGVYLFPSALTGEGAVAFGPTQSGGSSLLWMAKEVLHVSYPELIALAEKSVPGSNGLVFLPYICGERAPIWDANAKGSFFGIKQSHTSADFARAVLEGVAFSIRSILEATGEKDIQDLRLLGGGSQVPLWCQIRADVLGTTVTVVDCAEACAQGAAILAGIGCGVYATFREAALKTCKTGAVYLPNAENKAIYDRNYGVYRELYRATKHLM